MNWNLEMIEKKNPIPSKTHYYVGSSHHNSIGGTEALGTMLYIHARKGGWEQTLKLTSMGSF